MLDQLVERRAPMVESSGNSVGVPASWAAKRASPPTATNESMPSSGPTLTRFESVFEMCCRKRLADCRGACPPVENISCSRIEPSRRLCDLAISPFSRRVSSVLPPPTLATRANRWLTPKASPTAWHTAETVKRLSSEVSMTSTESLRGHENPIQERLPVGSALAHPAPVATARTFPTW